MMMGGMGNSGGSMGMDSMMNMGGGASGGMNMGNMQGMAGIDPSAMNGMVNQMPGWQNGMQGMVGMNPNAAAGVNNGLLGLGGFDISSFLSGILNLTINILVIVLFVALMIGAAVLIKRYLFDGEIMAVRANVVCGRCGQSLRSDWHVCPKCGEPKVGVVNTAPQTA